MAAKAADRLLLIDLGNSKADCAEVRADAIIRVFSAPAGVHTGEMLRRGTDGRFDAAAVASVNPPVWKTLEPALAEFCDEVLLARRDFEVPIRVDLERPEEVGTDRLVGALAAFERFGASLVVDCGSAVTFDVVSPECVYLGGAIAPGLHLTARALAEWTALLPKVEPEPNPPLLGKSTEQAISSGLVNGLAAMIDGMVERYRRALPFEFTAVATGGAAAVIFPMTTQLVDFIPVLTLEGVHIACQRAVRGG